MIRTIFPFNNLLITCDNYRSNNYKNSLLFDRKCCQATTMTVVLISTSLLMWTLKFLLNFCSIYILIVVNAIVQNLHLSCYTTWKKSPWEGFVTKDYKYRMWFNNISFKRSKIIYLYGKEMWIWIFPEIPFYIRHQDILNICFVFGCRHSYDWNLILSHCE